MKDFAAEEIEVAKAKIDTLDTELQKLLLPKDADDDKNIFIEVRAGTGGDEAALFAGDLLRMYSRYAERNRWQVESSPPTKASWAVIKKSSPASSAWARTVV